MTSTPGKITECQNFSGQQSVADWPTGILGNFPVGPKVMRKKSFIKQGTEDIYYLPKEIIASKKPYLNLHSIYATFFFLVFSVISKVMHHFGAHREISQYPCGPVCY
jgi:hypothetical protein